MTEISIMFVLDPTWRLKRFLIEAHSSQDFGGRGIGLAIERKRHLLKAVAVFEKNQNSKMKSEYMRKQR